VHVSSADASAALDRDTVIENHARLRRVAAAVQADAATLQLIFVHDRGSIVLVFLVACCPSQRMLFCKVLKEKNEMTRQPGTYAVFDTSEGQIVCRLFPKEAPKTVQNFTDLAEGKRDWKDSVSGKKGPGPLYNGTIFHRVIPNFMIQGGDPSGSGMGGPGYKFEDETKGSPHKFDKAGKLAMANAGPNTNGSQIFITVAPTEWLTGKHTIFGEVVEGYEIVEKISKVPQNRENRPLKDVVINAVRIERV
jgi:peptidyl-prolyl cis-trans isomerase A (cyclophilin A)